MINNDGGMIEMYADDIRDHSVAAGRRWRRSINLPRGSWLTRRVSLHGAVLDNNACGAERCSLDSRAICGYNFQQMLQFWWVNHNQTARQEIDGQYLWSPKTESNGARSEFYNNMRRATPGAPVLSSSGPLLPSVGRVAAFACPEPPPEEFGVSGA